MASFSNKVKSEICRSITDSDKKYACLYGIILYSRHLNEKRISVHTESDSFFELMRMLLKDVFGCTEYDTEITDKKNGCKGYYINIIGKAALEKVYSTYGIDLNKRTINQKNIVNNSLNAFLAGVFFVCGSITDPNREYHMEFTVQSEELFSDLDNILCRLGISAGRTERKGNSILYIKDSENIEDILTFIGAQQCTLDLMNIKIYKDVRNKVNRIANCDSANIIKTISAAVRQTRDIDTLKNCGKFEELPKELKEVAELRLAYPEYNMQEIGESLSKPIGRSGVTRRFQKISAIAAKLNGKDDENIGK